MSFMNEDPGSELEPGQHLGPYRLEELLGEGGMGLVFKASRESDGAVVALKVMRFELIEDPVFGRRFEQEARAAAEVSEPHLVPVLEAGQADGRRFLASKYIDGKTLDEHARRRATRRSPTPPSTPSTSARDSSAPRGRDRAPRPEAVEHHHRSRPERRC